jgi:hypothetical protein
MNQPTLTNRQVALQCAIEYSKKSTNMNSYTIVSVAERFRKFLDEGIVEVDPDKIKSGTISVNGGSPMSTTTSGWRPRVGNG